jgi:hypothetical protein
MMQTTDANIGGPSFAGEAIGLASLATAASFASALAVNSR